MFQNIPKKPEEYISSAPSWPTFFDIQQQFIEQNLLQSNGIIQKKVYQKMKFLSEHPSVLGKYYVLKDVSENKLYRAKIIFKSQLQAKEKANLLIEIENQKKFDHPNFVKLHKVFENENYVYLLSQMCENGSLEELIQRKKRLSEQEVGFYFANLISILVELKKKKIIHRNLRVDIIQLGNDLSLKLGDFGLSCVYQGEKRKSMLRLNHYSSPQIVDRGGRGYGYETDLWSIGVITYVMLIGNQPFKHEDNYSIPKIQNANVFFPTDIYVSPFWKNLLKRMLIVNLQHRITLSDLQSIQIPGFVSELPRALLNVTNRFPHYFERRKKVVNTKFMALHETNFKAHSTIEVSKIKPEPSRVGKSEITNTIGLNLIMTYSKTYGKDNFSVVDDWIISDDTIAYQIGCFVCVNFPDKTRIYNSQFAIYYLNIKGQQSIVTEEIASSNKNIHKKFRYYKSMAMSFDKSLEEENAVCPFFIDKVFVEEKFIMFLLSNGCYQLNFIDEPSCSYLMISKGKVLYYKKGKQSEQAVRAGEAEKIITSFRRKARL